jgi:hypothetical protein
MFWITTSVGRAGLGNERQHDATVLDASLSVGSALVTIPPGVGEVSAGLVPRLQFRRLGGVPDVDASIFGAGTALTVDWATQCSVGFTLIFDLEWLSSRPLGDSPVQSTLRLGATYRLFLFRRAPGRKPVGGS